MNTHSALVVTLALGLLAAPLAANAQRGGKVVRVGFLGAASPSPVSQLVDAFRQGLRDAGYVEGQNLAVEYRWAEGKLERLPDLAAELVRLRMDVIVAANAPSAQAAKNATRTIPIVFAILTDPVREGFVASLARPGGNITGLTVTPSPQIYGKHLELLKETLPKVSRVAVLWNPGNPGHTLILREAEVAAQALGVQLQLLEVRGPDHFESALAATTRERMDALLVLTPDPIFFVHRRRLADLAARRGLPTMFGVRDFVEAGGLMAYGANIRENFRRAATYVDKILKGAKPADLPVEQPTKFELVINLKTAKALGLTIPPSVLIRADEVIQ